MGFSHTAALSFFSKELIMKWFSDIFDSLCSAAILILCTPFGWIGIIICALAWKIISGSTEQIH